MLDHEETKNYLLPSIRSAVSDKSWRVRYMVADHFVEVCIIRAILSAIVCSHVSLFFSLSLLQLASAVGEEVVRDELVQAFVQLLKDNEAEVRTAGAGQIPGTYGFFCCHA